MGEVYRGRDTKLNRDVALKVLPAAFANDTERLARFMREAQTLAALNHPNIAQIYGIEDNALVMEFVEGEDLSALIRGHDERRTSSGERLDWALPIARQIADALEAAHERGIVHRDLKPANVRVRPDYVVKVLDFGLAKTFDAESATPADRHAPSNSALTMTSPAMTAMGMILGTAAYMAPEQARGRAVDKRADIWAFGAVLFEMLTGRRAFPGEDVADTIVSVVSKEPDWNALPPATPAGLRRLLARCLAKDPKARLRDIGEARVQLDELLSGAPDAHAAMPASPAATTPQPRSRAARALPWVLAVSTIAFATAWLADFAPWRSPAPTSSAPWTFARKTTVPQSIFNARLMPDDETIVFSAALSGNASALFELRSGSRNPRAFGPPSTHLLSISNKGELAVLTSARYLGHRLMSGTLARMNLDGAPRPLADDVREADWLPDGSDLVVIRDVPGGDHLEFPIGHTVHRTTGYLSDPRVSPDGTRVAFMEHPFKFDNRGWVKVVDRSGVVTTLAGEYGGEEGVAWTTDGRSVLFATSSNGPVYSVPGTGDAPATVIMRSAGGLIIHDTTADGRLLVTRQDNRTGVVARSAGQDAERDLTTIGSEWEPSLSNDGRLVVFTQSGGPDYLAIMRSTDGGPPAELGPGNVGAFSPDDQWVTANLFSTGQCVVYPTGAGRATPVPMGPLESCIGAGWFPDGKTLLLRGNEPGKPTRTYQAPFPGGTPQLLLESDLTPQGFRGSRGGSRSGSCLLATEANGAWRRFDINGPASPVPYLKAEDTLLRCDREGRWAIVSDDTVIPARVYQVDLVTGARKTIAELAPADRVGLLRVFVNDYRANGQYAYWYSRGLSTLYLAARAE